MDIQFGAIMNNIAMNVFEHIFGIDITCFNKLLLIGYIGLAKCLFNKFFMKMKIFFIFI